MEGRIFSRCAFAFLSPSLVDPFLYPQILPPFSSLQGMGGEGRKEGRGGEGNGRMEEGGKGGGRGIQILNFGISDPPVPPLLHSFLSSFLYSGAHSPCPHFSYFPTPQAKTRKKTYPSRRRTQWSRVSPLPSFHRILAPAILPSFTPSSPNSPPILISNVRSLCAQSRSKVRSFAQMLLLRLNVNRRLPFP